MPVKFKMTVVINRSTTPNLHEALSQCPTDRESAARLRALAESALAGQGMTFRTEPARAPMSQPMPQPGPHDAVHVVPAYDEQPVGDALSEAIVGDLGRF